MSKDYIKLLSLNSSEGSLNFEECQQIHAYLANVDFHSIPIEQHLNIKDFIIQSLIVGNVEDRHIQPLKNLLEELEKTDIQ